MSVCPFKLLCHILPLVCLFAICKLPYSVPSLSYFHYPVTTTRVFVLLCLSFPAALSHPVSSLCAFPCHVKSASVCLSVPSNWSVAPCQVCLLSKCPSVCRSRSTHLSHPTEVCPIFPLCSVTSTPSVSVLYRQKPLYLSVCRVQLLCLILPKFVLFFHWPVTRTSVCLVLSRPKSIRFPAPPPAAPPRPSRPRLAQVCSASRPAGPGLQKLVLGKLATLATRFSCHGVSPLPPSTFSISIPLVFLILFNIFPLSCFLFLINFYYIFFILCFLYYSPFLSFLYVLCIMFSVFLIHFFYLLSISLYLMFFSFPHLLFFLSLPLSS